jgi:hypothetical protein
MIGTLPAECLLAVTGLWPNHPPSDTQKRLAQRFPQRLTNRVKTFLESDKAEKFKAPSLPDQKQFHAKLLEKLDPEELEGAFSPDEAELAVHYSLLLQRTRDKVVAAWPTYPDPSLGIHNFDLAPDELLDVLQLFNTLDSVESIFDDLDARVLLPDQVTAFAAAYPDLYETLQNAIREELTPSIPVGDEVQKQTLSAIKEEQIRILLQLPADAPVEAPLAAAAGPQGQLKPGRRPPANKEDETNLQTPSEHIADRRVST